MKIKDLLKITGISLLGVLGVGMCIFGSAKGMTLLADNYMVASAYSYSDNDYEIVLTEEELENEFTHLQAYIIEHHNLTDTQIICEQDTYTLTFSEYAPNGIQYNYENGNNYLSITFGGYDDDETLNKLWNIFGEFNEGATTIESFSSEIYWKFTDNDTEYEGIKNAIAQDLTPSPTPTDNMLGILGQIIGLLTGGIVGLSGGLGTGVSTLTTQIFISNNALSVFGGMIVVFAGISLAIGLCRWLMQFLTSLGAKK